jgi:hypothetical protein
MFVASPVSLHHGIDNIAFKGRHFLSDVFIYRNNVEIDLGKCPNLL